MAKQDPVDELAAEDSDEVSSTNQKSITKSGKGKSWADRFKKIGAKKTSRPVKIMPRKR